MKLYELCIATPAGWRRETVELDVPPVILSLEAKTRAEQTVNDDERGALKRYWRNVAQSLTKGYDLGDITCILREAK